MMKLSDFSYNLPKTQIAKYPVSPRDKSKLLVVNRETGDWNQNDLLMLLIICRREMFWL